MRKKNLVEKKPTVARRKPRKTRQPNDGSRRLDGDAMRLEQAEEKGVRYTSRSTHNWPRRNQSPLARMASKPRTAASDDRVWDLAYDCACESLETIGIPFFRPAYEAFEQLLQEGKVKAYDIELFIRGWAVTHETYALEQGDLYDGTEERREISRQNSGEVRVGVAER